MEPLEPEIGDAFGLALLSCLEAGVTPWCARELIERDDGHLEAADISRYFGGPESFGELERWACLQAGRRILDIGSGAGRYALPLQEEGRELVALDISPLALEVCRRRGVRDTFEGSVEDLAAARPRPFDTFLLMGANLGLLESREHAPRFLAALSSMAAPEAVIVGAGRDAGATSELRHLNYHERNRRAGRMPGQIRLRVRHQRIATPWFDYLFPSIEELGELIAPTAWTLREWKGEPPAYLAILAHEAAGDDGLLHRQA